MTDPLVRLLAIGLATLLLAAPVAVEQPAEALDEASDGEEISLHRIPDAGSRSVAVGDPSVGGSFDPTIFRRSLSRPPPPGAVR
jgi:hypothetical protein